MAECTLCPDLVRSRRCIVLPTACPTAGLLAIGEAPGAEEELSGQGFAGQAGRNLDAMLAVHGIARDDYGRANMCRCRPLRGNVNRAPTRQEQAACLPNLVTFIQACRPRILLLVGRVPTAAFLGEGALYPHILASRAPDRSAWTPPHPGMADLAALEMILVPTVHTSYLALNRNAPNGRKWADVAREQIAWAVKHLGASS